MTTILVLQRTEPRPDSALASPRYGRTLADIGARSRRGGRGSVTIDLRQTDDEAKLIGWIHEAVDRRLRRLGPAAFTHYSYALRDAAAQLNQAGVTLVEVHLSNPHTRETSGTRA